MPERQILIRNKVINDRPFLEVELQSKDGAMFKKIDSAVFSPNEENMIVPIVKKMLVIEQLPNEEIKS